MRQFSIALILWVKYTDWETLKSRAIRTMSRGYGYIQRRLLAVFSNDPTGVFSTVELCRLVFEVKDIKKKHRVSVIRALKLLAKRSNPKLWRTVLRCERKDDEWFDHSKHHRFRDSAPANDQRPSKVR
jgi:hypothetical protein